MSNMRITNHSPLTIQVQSGKTVTHLCELNDVMTEGVQEGEVLTYQASSNTWVSGGFSDQFARDRGNTTFDLLNIAPVIVAHSAVSTLAADTNTSQTLVTVTVPGGSLGPNGWVECTATWTMGGTANAKGLNIRTLGSSGTRITSFSATNHIAFYQAGEIHNRANTQQQVSGQPQQIYYGSNASEGMFNHTINTNNDWEIHFTVTKITPTDRVTLEQYTVTSQYRA